MQIENTNNNSRKVEHNLQLQAKYDEDVNAPTVECILRKQFDPLGDESMYLVSGQNAYFNEYIENNGLNNVKVDKDDAEILRQLFSLVSLFGKPKNYVQSGSILYVTPVGKLELQYSRQSFPSGILEDILGWGEKIKYQYPWYSMMDTEPVEIVVGESESNYWMRVVNKLIDLKRNSGGPLTIDGKVLSEEELKQFKARVNELFKKFCVGKNRLYFINIMQILNNRISGYAEHLRTGSVSEQDYLKEIMLLRTVREIIDGDSTNIEENAKAFIRKNKTEHSQWGLAIFGEISGPISYVEIKTSYTLLQEYFLSKGYASGDVIHYDEIYKLYDKETQSTK